MDDPPKDNTAGTEATFQLDHEPSFGGVLHGVVQTPEASK